MTGRVIDSRFEVLERVGEGALFQVSKARDTASGRVVAVKMLKQSAAGAPDISMLLRRVAPDLINLHHANIARLEEIGEENGLPYLVTEFVRGINLKERIRRIAPFTLSVAVDFAIAVGEALAQAHSEGVVHGDLRPQNVIVSPEGAVKVSDFGLWQVVSASKDALASNLTRAVHYQAPEVVSGFSPSASTDLYSLGAILFEMLTGGLPYPADNPMMAAMKQQSDPVPSPRALNPGVPRSIEGIVMKALMKRPDDRYKTAADILNDLKSVRDALRFGKPLSWSPLEPAPAAAAPTVNIRRAREDSVEPSTVGAARMSATTASDDRLSPFLKIALAAVTLILITVGIAGVAIWMATMAAPPEATFPRMVGTKIDTVRSEAGKASLRLMEHEEYNDKTAAGVVFKIDPDLTGKPVRAGRSVNIWISKGSRYVDVPDVIKLFKDDAQKKLEEAGLALGQVDVQYDKTVPQDHVIAQNPKKGKRVLRDFAVNLMISEGPDPSQDTSGSGNASNTENGAAGTGTGTDANVQGGTNPSDTGEIENDLIPRTIKLSIPVRKDGKGPRRVRMEYDDAEGTKTAINETHKEGETVETRVKVIGRKVTVRVFFGDDPVPISTQTKILPLNP